MTFKEKIAYLEEKHSEICKVLFVTAPTIVDDPDSASEQEIGEYNFWIEALPESEAISLYEPC